MTVKSYEYRVDDPPAETTTREYEPKTAQVVPISVRVEMKSGKSKLVMLREAKKRAEDRTENARAAAKEKRDTRHERGEYLSRDVRVWFEKACSQYTRLSRLPSWRPQDHTNAKRMLAEFGGDTLKGAVFWFFEHWEAYVAASKGKLNGIPTPSLMIAMKSQVFVDFEIFLFLQ